MICPDPEEVDDDDTEEIEVEMEPPDYAEEQVNKHLNLFLHSFSKET